MFVFFPTITSKYVYQLLEKTLFLSVFDILGLRNPHFQEIVYLCVFKIICCDGHILSMKFCTSILCNRKGYRYTPEDRDNSDISKRGHPDMDMLGTGTEIENIVSRDLQVRTSFAKKKIVFLIFVKCEINGENKFENKKYQNRPHLSYNVYFMDTVKKLKRILFRFE